MKVRQNNLFKNNRSQLYKELGGRAKLGQAPNGEEQRQQSFGMEFGSMRDWNSVLTSNGEVLGEVRIKRGIFQGDSLSPLLFVLSMIPIVILLKRENIGYKFGKEQKMMNHLLYMDDLN